MQISKKARWDQIIDEFSKSKYGNKKSAEINLIILSLVIRNCKAIWVLDSSDCLSGLRL